MEHFIKEWKIRSDVYEDLHRNYFSSLCFCDKEIIILQKEFLSLGVTAVAAERVASVEALQSRSLHVFDQWRRARGHGGSIGLRKLLHLCQSQQPREWRARKSIKPNLAAAVPCHAVHSSASARPFVNKQRMLDVSKHWDVSFGAIFSFCFFLLGT